MARLKRVTDSLNGLSDKEQSLYEKRDDGKYHLFFEVETDTDTSGLKDSRNKLLDENKRLEERLSAFGDIDADMVKKLKSEEAERKRKADEDAGNYEQILAQAKKSYDDNLSERDGRIQSLESSLTREMITRRSDEAILKYEGNPKLLGPHVRDQLKIIEDDNGVSEVFVVDEKGTALLSKDAKTAKDYMTPDELVSSMKDSDDFAGAFKGSGATGGGASTERTKTNTGEKGTLTELPDGGHRFI